ncbi:MAG: helix-turn-helix transcriptional regulator [Chitinophagales bacterium]
MPKQKVLLEFDYYSTNPNHSESPLYFVAITNNHHDMETLEVQELCTQINAFLVDYQNRKSSSLNTYKTKQKHYFKCSNEDRKWLKELAVITFKNLGSHNFNVEFLSTKMDLSRRQLHRKLKRLTKLNPTEYLREARLQQAHALLQNQTYPLVKMVCYKVGMRDLKHFTNLFKKRFGYAPSDCLGMLLT